MTLKKYFTVALLGLLVYSRFSMAQNSTHTNSVGMEFIRIDSGSMIVGKFQPPYPVPDDTVKGASRPMVMWMGDGRPYNNAEFKLARELAVRDASPGFKVRIERAFYLGKYEVTQAQWKKVMGDNPSVFQGAGLKDSDNHPVGNVSWEDAQRFVRRLNSMETGKKYRLPLEFEWEFAARAGAQGDIPWPETQQVAQLGGTTTYAVGQKAPNAWGLFDMLGNVWEWVEDYYNEKIFADAKPPSQGSQHVLKGASFVGDFKNATWLTHAAGPGNGWDVGFRVVLELAEE
jgi:sulfatase modifying factor 1